MTWNPWEDRYTIGNLENGASKTITMRGVITKTEDASVINTVAVTSSTKDPNLRNNASSAETGMIPFDADLAITKQASPKTANVGETVTYTITVINNGPDFAEEVRLADDIPENLSNVQFSADSGNTWNDWENPYMISTLAKGASRTILIRGTVTRRGKF